MSDTFTTVTTKGWGDRIMGSIKGIATGFLLFISSFGVLYWNEGRTDMSEVAATAIEIQATGEASEDANGKLISVTGEINSKEKLGDIFIQKGEYLSLKRKVEVFAWVEEEKTTTETNTGGSETTTTTYSYEKEWTNDPENSSQFAKPEGHTNPGLSIKSATQKVQKGKVGEYDVTLGMAQLPSTTRISLTEKNVIESDGFTLANSEYLFKAGTLNNSIKINLTSKKDDVSTNTVSTNSESGTISNPQIGNIRVSYSAVLNPIQQGTVFGELHKADKIITQYSTDEGDTLYRVFDGSRKAAIGQLADEHSFMTWLLRGIGFVMMWAGLQAILSVLSTVLDVLPFLGSLSRGLVKIATFVISAVLSIVTILISMILHNIWAIIIVVLLAGVGIYLYLKDKQKKLDSGEESLESLENIMNK